MAALRAIRRKAANTGKKQPTGVYWCGRCHKWHLTSKSESRPAPWERTTPTTVK